MAFLRTANAIVVKPNITPSGWGQVRGTSKVAMNVSRNLATQATDILGQPFDPNRWLLTHCTIVASVDVSDVANVKLGSFQEGNRSYMRKYADFRITPNTTSYINNNFDSFERKALLKSYRTFIGAQNFCFAPDTMILMADGTYKNITEIRVGDQVRSHTGESRAVNHLFVRDYIGDVVALQFGGCTVVATPNHPFLHDGAWINASELQAGDVLSGHTLEQSRVDTYSGKVYNFEVDVDNSYVVYPGVAVHNCEHVQVEDLSKGRIIDAVPRDIGDSVYVDILVATERKHSELVRDIESGKMNGLSMGCSTLFTICSKCGNVAEDETQLCDCIKYNKGNTFIDERGQRTTIAELCGHHTVEPTAGITFIEASWVANPAFTGAVARNILSPESLNPATVKQAQQILTQPPKEWVQGDHVQKSAAFDFGDMGDDSGGGGDSEPAPEKKEPASVLDKLQDDVLNDIVDRVHTKILDEMSKKDKPDEPIKSITQENEAIQKSAAIMRKSYAIAVGTIIRNASSDADVMDKVAMLDRQFGSNTPVKLYRIALTVGSIDKRGGTENYLRACGDAMGRKLSASETNALVRLGRVLNHVGATPVSSPMNKQRSNK